MENKGSVFFVIKQLVVLSCHSRSMCWVDLRVISTLLFHAIFPLMLS